MTPPGLLAPGAVFAKDYTVVRPLSEGGMGAIYVVQQISTGAPRALKLMHPQLVREPRLRQRFEQEARVGARIESDHVVQVLGAGIDEASGMPWLVMELLNGHDLGRLIDKAGPLPLAQARDVFAQFTHAVAAAHRVGIVHRDLKPENIFVAVAHREGMAHLVKVLDFGIAKIVAEAKAATTQALGTPIWMAPEQTETGRSIRPAADVWSLGLIAFRMFTGKHFWVSANSAEATATMVLREAVIDPIVPASQRAREYGREGLLPAGFDAWFARCVVRDLAARFENAALARDAFFETLDRGALAPAGARTIAAAPPGFTVMGAPAGPFGPTALTPGYAAHSMHTAPAQTTTAAGPPQMTRSAWPPQGTAPGEPPQGMAPATTAPPGGYYAPVGLTVGASSRSGAPHLPAIPVAPGQARRGGSGGKVAVVLGLLVAFGGVGLGGVGLVVRAVVQGQKARACEAGTGDDLPEACRAACASEPETFCVKQGDLARAGLDATSLNEAAESYEKACDAGDFLGCRKLGSLKELRKDEAAALASYQKSCDGKSASGCAWLGARMERGRGIARDLSRAAAMYESACAGDDPASCALQGFRAENRPIPRPDAADVEALYRKAVPALQKECSAGGLVECVQLGYLVQGGKGAERDVAAAGALFRKACEGGLSDGCNNEAVLGVIAGGVGGGGKAAEALRTACAAGSTAACSNLAMLQANVPLALRQQQGVSLFAIDCNDDVPFGCTHNSAASPEPPAGVPKDLAAAVAALRTACADGVGVACGNLGAFQESGYGVSRDAALAVASYDQACAAGAPDGCGTMKESPFRAGDVWRGVYTCGRGQGNTDVWLRFFEPTTDARVNAVFDLDYRGGMTKGRFLVSGAYDAARGSITLAPGKWVDAPPGWLPVGMTGHVSAQKTVFMGKMDSPQCGPFYMVRHVSDMFDTKCAAGSRFVEGHGCVPTPREGATVLGTWTGQGTESTGRTWAMTATVENLESGRCGHVAFPGLNCTGDWYCTMSSDGKQIRAREVITSGQGKCDTTGVMEFTVSDDGQSADYKWTSPLRNDVSSAHLTRAAK